MGMSALLMCCGYYCSFTALIGVYFFIVIAIMEWNRNPWLIVEKQSKTGDPDAKGWAFIILAAIELVLVFLCFWCGSHYSAVEKEKAEKERAKELEAFGVDVDSGDQIVS